MNYKGKWRKRPWPRTFLEAQITELQNELDRVLAAIPFDSSQVYAVTLPGTDEQPGASAQLVIDSGLQYGPAPCGWHARTAARLCLPGAAHPRHRTRKWRKPSALTPKAKVFCWSIPPNRSRQSFDAVGVSIEPRRWQRPAHRRHCAAGTLTKGYR